MTIGELADQLLDDVRGAMALWASTPGRASDPLVISMPCARADLIANKLREASSLLVDCANVITVLHAEAQETDSLHDQELADRLAGRIRLIAVRLANFQTIDPHHSVVVPVRGRVDTAPEIDDEQRTHRIRVDIDTSVPGRQVITMPDPTLTDAELARIRLKVRTAVDEEFTRRAGPDLEVIKADAVLVRRVRDRLSRTEFHDTQTGSIANRDAEVAALTRMIDRDVTRAYGGGK